MEHERARTVLVTGGAGGIGLAVCRRLVAGGWRVVATAHPSEATTELERAGVAQVLTVDLLDAASIDLLVGELAAEPRWDAFVSNAGVSIPGPVEGVPVERLREQLEVNTVAPVRLVQALLPALRERRGRIVFIGAGQGRVALPFGGPYGASKAALTAVADALGAELHGVVAVSVIEPGAVRTGILSRSRDTAGEVLASMSPEIAILYRKRMDAVFARSSAAFERASRPERLADLVARVLEVRNPRPRYVFGRDARALAIVALLPARLRARLVSRLAR